MEALTSRAAKARVLAAERAIIKRRSQETSTFAGWAAKGLAGLVSPRAHQAIESATGKAYAKARRIDEAVAGQLARVPYVGAAFRGVQRGGRRIIEKTPRGDVAEVVEVPTASLLEPVEKVKRVAVPVAALIGIESLTRPIRTSRGERQMEPKYAEVLKAASVVIQDQDAEIKKRSIAMDKLADGQLKLQHEKNATSFALELLERGVIEKDGLREKIAALVVLTPEQLELEKRALAYIDSGASVFGHAEGSATKQAGSEGSEPQSNEVLDYLAEFVHSNGLRSQDTDED
jgi:hypothetical protein